MKYLHLVSSWPLRRWIVAATVGLATALALGLPTDVIPNPWFGRTVDVTWWAAPTLALTAAMCGMLAATYVAHIGEAASTSNRDRRTAGVGAVLGFFAIGCPVCNKLVLLAFGTTGALNWFEPAQPVMAVASLLVVSWALLRRLEGESACLRAAPRAARP